MGYKQLMRAVMKKRKLKLSIKKMDNVMNECIVLERFLELLILELSMLGWAIITNDTDSMIDPNKLSIIIDYAGQEMALLLPGVEAGTFSAWRINMRNSADRVASSLITNSILPFGSVVVRQLKHLHLKKFAGQFKLFTGLTRITEVFRTVGGLVNKSIANMFNVSP